VISFQGRLKMPKAGLYSYPYYDLDSVIDKLKTAHNVIRTDEMDREVIAEAISMTSTGGAYAMVISSMENFGLIETAWGGKITLTNLGKNILYGNEIEQENAKKDAFLNISLFKEIFSKYGVNATEEQFRAFLRQEGNVDITKVKKKAQESYRIYQKFIDSVNMYKSITPVQDMTQQEPSRLSTHIPSTGEYLTIRYGDVLIQLPPDDLEALSLAKEAITFMEERIKRRKIEDQEKPN